MKKRNLSAKKKIHNFYFKILKNPRIKKIYLQYEKNLDIKNSSKFSVAISGGPDSMALAFLSKCHSILKKVNYYYFTVDHKLRLNSTKEAIQTKRELRKYGINCEILTWKNNQARTNIQAKAREKRYELIFNKSLKKKINFVLTAHHKDDLFENFFIRLLRGSGLKGLISFREKKVKIDKKNIYLLRPLLNISKKDLDYIVKNSFKFKVNDPSNIDDKFLRIKIRILINKLKQDGLNFKKFNKTLENLNKSNKTIEFYVNKNINENTNFLNGKKSIILNENFFGQPDEIVFRSLSVLIHSVGDKKNYTRGKKILNLMNEINLSENFKKLTLSGCIIEKVNKSHIISRGK